MFLYFSAAKHLISRNQAEFLMVWSGLEQYQPRTTLYIAHFKNTKYFLLHAVWYEDRAIQLLKFSMSQEVKKGPFAALTIESSKNFILTYFQKPMWFYLLATKDRLLGKVWGKTLFRCEMPWTALTEVAT